jgi:hypothetical protein
MKNLLVVFVLIAILISCNTADKEKAEIKESAETESVMDSMQLKPINTDIALIATALMAVPKNSRSRAKVIGYNMAGEFVTLREGDNEFICLADDPKKDGFSAACYHKDLEPFMARGRELKAAGKTRPEIFKIREEEVKSGKLTIKSGLTLQLYYGMKAAYDPATAQVAGAQYRYVVYMPWATGESTGIPTVPRTPNQPWLMDAGTHRAHIMITPIQTD